MRSAPALLALVLAGCLAAPEAPAPASTTMEPAPPAASVLAGTLEPDALEAPVFDVLDAVTGGRLGEPSVWAHTDGTLYMAAPGCDRNPNDPTDTRVCRSGLVFRSDDAGASWTRLNRDEDGALVDDRASYANGDAEVAVDAAGVVYASNLGRGIQVFRSEDRGASWTHLGNATPEGHWADRQWMAAGAPGHLVVTWMGGEESDLRKVAVNTTFDGGATWTGTSYLGGEIGWLGPVALSLDGERAYIPFTERLGGPLGSLPPPLDIPSLLLGEEEFGMFVGASDDGGRTWEVLDTGVRIVRTATGGHWSGVLMAPALDVTGDGHVVVAWAEDVADPSGATSTGAAVKWIASGDQGTTWSEPRVASEVTSAIMPWVVGGAGDRFALTYYGSPVPLDSDYAGRWDVLATVVDGASAEDPTLVHATVAEGVHEGGLCARGGTCLLTASDRDLLDYFESDVLPDGRLVVTYASDRLDDGFGRLVRVGFAAQSGGTPLLLRSEAGVAAAP